MTIEQRQQPPLGDNLAKPETTYKAPECRLKSASAALNVVNRIIQDNDKRQAFYKRLQGQLDGNPPYRQADLAKNAQNYRANFNSMESDSLLDTATTPHYDLYSSNKFYFFIKTKVGGSGYEKDAHSKRLSEIANRHVDEWFGFDNNNQCMINDMVWFGKGFLMWEDEMDWRYTYIPQWQVLVPNGSTTEIEKLSVMVIPCDLKVDELWQMSKSSRAGERGWNQQEVLRAIWNATPRDPTAGVVPNYMDLQQSLNDNDIQQGYASEVIRIAHIYTKEFDGRITHGIVCRDGIRYEAQGSSDGKLPAFENWLFHKIGRFKNWREMISPFFLKNSKGSWNGAHGLGKSVFSIVEARNRMWCSSWDLGFLDTGIWLQCKTSSSMQKAALVQNGSFNFIPPDFEVMQTQIRGNMDAPIAMLNESDSLLQRNTGVYRPNMVQKPGNPQTATQYQQESQKAQTLSNAMVQRFFRNLDKHYTELVRRLLKDADFKKEVLDANLPKEVLEQKNVDSVKASRVIGNGSPQNRATAVASSMSIVPMLPETGRLNWLNDAIAAVADQDTVERWNPSEGAQEPTDHKNIAALENIGLTNGGRVYVTPQQNHVIHCQEHFQGIVEAGQAIQQGGDEPKILMAMNTMHAHAQNHLAALAKDPTRKQAFKALLEQWKQLRGVIDELQGRVQGTMKQQKQRAQKAKQMQMDPLTQVKVQQAQQAMMTKQQKHQQLMANKQESHQLDMAERQQDMAMKDAETAAKIHRESFSAFKPE